MRSNWKRRSSRALSEMTFAMWTAEGLASASPVRESQPPEAPAPENAADSSTQSVGDSTTEPPTAPAADQDSKARSAPVRRELPQFRVVLHNDDFTPMDHVVRSIVSLTPLPRSRAHLVMLMAHTRGSALLLITHRERAELYQQQFRGKGLIVTLEAM